MINREKVEMKGFTGSCLCRAITYNSNTAPLRTFNCHCEDCRKCSGAPYLTNIFVKEGDLYIQGTLKNYIHQRNLITVNQIVIDDLFLMNYVQIF